jgi:6-phosphofructokinase 1
MVRSVPASPPDAVYCMYLAQSAVHAALAGYTGFSVGLVNNRLVLLPITAITAHSPRRLNARGRTYERVLQLTRMPDPLSDPALRAQWEAREAARGRKGGGGGDG